MTEKSSAGEGEMPPLAPCPFCGGAPKFLALTESDGFEREYLVHCDECAISLGGEYQSEAIAAWNRREYAATSAAQAAGGGAWRPIETAPKDGTPILVSNADRGDSWIAMFKDTLTSGFKPENPWYSLMLNCNWHPNRMGSFWPTHWMPLPAAPDHPSPSREGPSDAEMLQAIANKIAAAIPVGFEIQLCLEREAGWVTLRNEEGDCIPLPDAADKRLHEQINDAVAAAKEHQP